MATTKHHKRPPGKRIDYRDIDVCKRRAEDKLKQRAAVVQGVYVLGRLIEDQGEVKLQCLRLSAGYMIDGSMTTQMQFFARWRTRQAVHQFLKFNDQFRGVRPINLTRLVIDVPSLPRPSPSVAVSDDDSQQLPMFES